MSHDFTARAGVRPRQSDLDAAGTESPRKISRKRRKPARLEEADGPTHDEERVLALALEKSRRDTHQPEFSVPEAPVFHPTSEEWSDPLTYISSIQPMAAPYGICKIVPPQGWNPSFSVRTSRLKFSTRRQRIDRLGEGVPYTDGKSYTLDEFKAMADNFRGAWERKMRSVDVKGGWSPTVAEIESFYWKTVEGGTDRPIKVDYGNDLDTLRCGSGFTQSSANYRPLRQVPADFMNDEYYARCGWNLNNIPKLPGSVLNHITLPINGINVPWLYFGMLFSTFCWHIEDNNLFSLNYLHLGSSKTWYGIPGAQAGSFEEAVRQMMPLKLDEEPQLLDQLVTMISPAWLMHRGVRVSHLTQSAGEFVVTFPAGYHAGFSHGFNCGEAVNFATADWLPFGRLSRQRYRRDARTSVVAHDKLVTTLASSDLGVFSVSELRALLLELEQLRKEEEDWRERLHVEGVKYAVKMPKEENGSDEADMRRQCSICKHPCSLSALICRCSPDKAVCLQHYKRLCDCDLGSKCFVFWKSVGELAALCDRVKVAVGNRCTKVQAPA